MKSDDFTEFWYARHDLPLRGINFEPYRAIKMPTPVGWVFLWYARHDSNVRPTESEFSGVS